jgi:hypothetical protein
MLDNAPIKLVNKCDTKNVRKKIYLLLDNDLFLAYIHKYETESYLLLIS